MTKYYINCGEIQILVLAQNSMHACMEALKRIPQKEIRISRVMRVSEKGFGKHKTDEYFSTELIFRMLLLARQREKL